MLPHLRGRLTLRRLTLHRKPWVFGEEAFYYRDWETRGARRTGSEPEVLVRQEALEGEAFPEESSYRYACPLFIAGDPSHDQVLSEEEFLEEPEEKR